MHKIIFYLNFLFLLILIFNNYVIFNKIKYIYIYIRIKKQQTIMVKMSNTKTIKTSYIKFLFKLQ